MAPLIYMLETLFAYQEIHNDSGNILRYNQICSINIKGYMAISMRYVASKWVPFTYLSLSGRMHHGNNYGSLNMHAIDMVSISIDSQWQWQYFEI